MIGHAMRFCRSGGLIARGGGLILAAFIAVSFATAPLFAQESPAPQGEAGSDSTTITFTARRMESVIAKGKEKTILIGEAVVNTGTMEIKSDRIELSGKAYTDVVCAGAVTVNDESKGFLLNAATLSYARDTEIGIAQTQVVLEDSKNSVLLKAEWVRFDQKQSLVDARLAVHILKEDFAVRAEFARYNRDDESLELSGIPVAVSADGRIAADTMTGKTDMQSLEFGGKVSGTITTKKKEGTRP